MWIQNQFERNSSSDFASESWNRWVKIIFFRFVMVLPITPIRMAISFVWRRSLSKQQMRTSDKVMSGYALRNLSTNPLNSWLIACSKSLHSSSSNSCFKSLLRILFKTGVNSISLCSQYLCSSLIAPYKAMCLSMVSCNTRFSSSTTYIRLLPSCPKHIRGYPITARLH